MISIPPKVRLKWYEQMLTIRKFEEKAIELFEHNLIRGNIHPCIGQEAIPVGVCSNLRRDDYMTSNHRGHGHCIAKGAEPRFMMAELLGRTSGYCRGKGGSMHIANFEGGNLGANGIVGGGIPISVGAGLGIQNRGSDQVVACFLGDGASNQGTFHESVNMAAIWKLPVIFVCENNLYAHSTPMKDAISVAHISERAKAYGIPGVTLDGMDVKEVYLKTKEAIERARGGQGPTLLECETYRFTGHHTGEPQRAIAYRKKEEIEEGLSRCPIERFRKILIREKILTQKMDQAIHERIEVSIEKAIQFAKESPHPSPEEAFHGLFC